MLRGRQDKSSAHSEAADATSRPDKFALSDKWTGSQFDSGTRYGRKICRLTSSGSPQLPNPFSLSDDGMNPREALPYLGGAAYLRVSPKVKAESDPIETNRTRPARIPLSWRTKVQQTTTA